MRGTQKETVVKTLDAHHPDAEVLDKVLESTAKKVQAKPKEEEYVAPKGYALLPAGPTRMLAVNQECLQNYRHYNQSYSEKPWILIEGKKETQYMEVIFLDEVSTKAKVAKEENGCSIVSRLTCRMITKGRVLVK